MWLAIAHALPERTRLRTPVLRKDRAACERVADAVAAIPGVREVRIRPYTGSVLIMHHSRVAIATLVDAVSRSTGCEKVLAAGEHPPIDDEVPAFSSLARKIITAARELDLDIRRSSGGTVDFGTLAMLGLFGAGAAEIAATGRLPMPPWFNLAWWGVRTFVTAEQDEIEHANNM